MGKTKNKRGIFTLVIGAICLFASLLINHYGDLDDILSVMLMIFSLMIEIYGLYQIIRDNYNK